MRIKTTCSIIYQTLYSLRLKKRIAPSSKPLQSTFSIAKWLLIAAIFIHSSASAELNVGLASSSDLYFAHVESIGKGKYLNEITQTVKDDLAFSNYFTLIKNRKSSVDTFFLKQKGNTLSLIQKPAFCDESVTISSFTVKDRFQGRNLAHQIADLICEIVSGKRGIASTKILYAKQIHGENKEGKSTWHSQIWQCDYDGKNHEPVVSPELYSITPVFLQRGHLGLNGRFLFVSYAYGQSKIFLSDAAITPFISLSGNQMLPSCAFQGDKIAFISDISGHVDLFIQYIDPASLTLQGKPIQVFSVAGSVQASPSFRPDGKKVAFVSDHEGTPSIYIIDVPEKAGKRGKGRYFCLTRKYRQNTSPCWSPDGRKLVYSAKIDGVRQIVVYDFIKKEEKQLTFSPVHKENPCWSPTGEHLVFNTIAGNASELFTFNLKQEKLVQITSGPHKKHYPCWGPYTK